MSARIGVIGCGWWATTAHLPALQHDDRAVIAALVDPDPDRLADAAARFEAERSFSSAESMFDAIELDGVVIAVPHAAHFPLGRLALEHGVHVLMEKPMVLEPPHAWELLALARERDRELLVGYPWNYNEQAAAVRDAVASGRIGTVENVSCLFASIVRELYAGRPEAYRAEFSYTLAAPTPATYSDPQLAGGGQGQTQVTHAAALLLWMTGLRAQRVSALTANFGLGVDLVDAMAIEFEGGALASLSSTGGLTPGHPELLEYRIFGTEGHILFDVNNGTLCIHDSSGVERAPDLPAERRYPQEAPVSNLVDIATHDGANRSPGTLGAQVVEISHALYRSSHERCVVELDRERAGG